MRIQRKLYIETNFRYFKPLLIHVPIILPLPGLTSFKIILQNFKVLQNFNQWKNPRDPLDILSLLDSMV